MDDNMIGKRFGKLVVIDSAPAYIAPSGGTHKKYVCVCDCGNTVSVLKEYLTSGRQKSCGCLKKLNGNPTHNEIHTRLYSIWGNMCNRCSNPNNPAWNNYGGRGIKVCKEWLKYECFRDWAYANGYNNDLTLDRINNDDGYTPSNCRWVDDYIQANNKRNNHLITYNGVTKTIAEWALYFEIPYKTLHHRIAGLKWTVERAFTQPMRKHPTKRNASNTMDG